VSNALQNTGGSTIKALTGGGYGSVAGAVLTRTQIVSPEFTFTDDFTGIKDTSFWGDGTWVTYGADATGSGYAGKVLSMRYQAGASGVDSFSEQRFALDDAVQVEMSYRVFIPANYTHRNDAPGNNKIAAFWSGDIGITASNISLYVESQPNSGNTKPDLYLGQDGANYGHTDRVGGADIFLDSDGAWHDVAIYFELSEQEGEYGMMEVWLDDVLILGTHLAGMTVVSPPIAEQIGYSTRGNFIDQGYIFGWSNAGFLEATTIYVADFSMKTRSTSVGATY